MPLLIVLPVAVVPISGLLAWWLWLRFCRHIFDRAGDAKAMSDAAVVATSFWRRSERHGPAQAVDQLPPRQNWEQSSVVPGASLGRPYLWSSDSGQRVHQEDDA